MYSAIIFPHFSARSLSCRCIPDLCLSTCFFDNTPSLTGSYPQQPASLHRLLPGQLPPTDSQALPGWQYKGSGCHSLTDQKHRDRSPMHGQGYPVPINISQKLFLPAPFPLLSINCPFYGYPTGRGILSLHDNPVLRLRSFFYPALRSQSWGSQRPCPQKKVWKPDHTVKHWYPKHISSAYDSSSFWGFL